MWRLWRGGVNPQCWWSVYLRIINCHETGVICAVYKPLPYHPFSFCWLLTYMIYFYLDNHFTFQICLSYSSYIALWFSWTQFRERPCNHVCMVHFVILLKMLISQKTDLANRLQLYSTVLYNHANNEVFLFTVCRIQRSAVSMLHSRINYKLRSNPRWQ